MESTDAVPPAATRTWAEIERYMERARDLRSATCAALFAAAFRQLLRRPFGRWRRDREVSMARAVTLGCALALGLVAMPDSSVAQDVSALQLERGARDGDRAQLGALGIDASAIEQCDDVAALWRAVRELVLPGRVSEPMQQRILRRVWMADREISDAVVVDSASN